MDYKRRYMLNRHFIKVANFVSSVNIFHAYFDFMNVNLLFEIPKQDKDSHGVTGLFVIKHLFV